MIAMPRAEYDALRAAAEEAQEDAEDLVIAERRWAEWEASGRLTTPPDVARMILDGAQVHEAFRKHHGLSIDELAARSAVEPARIKAIEDREIVGDAATLSALADAMGIDRVWLMPSLVEPSA